MGFRVPTFNLLYTVWDRSAVPAGPVITANLGAYRKNHRTCQLRAPGKQSSAQDAATYWIFCPELLVPAGRDLRDSFSWDGANLTGPDLVEVPEGTGNYYTVAQVCDVAKGFANEYRMAMILANPYKPAPML